MSKFFPVNKGDQKLNRNFSVTSLREAGKDRGQQARRPCGMNYLEVD